MNTWLKRAFDKYETWCADGHPAQNLGNTLELVIGYLANCTDGEPDYDERALLALVAARLRDVNAKEGAK